VGGAARKHPYIECVSLKIGSVAFGGMCAVYALKSSSIRPNKKGLRRKERWIIGLNVAVAEEVFLLRRTI